MPNHYLSEQQIAQLVFGFYELFKPVNELKRQFYIGQTTVYDYLNNNAERFGYPKPSLAHIAKANKIREEYICGAKPREIMKTYGLNKNTLYTYIYGKQYGGKPERVVQV